MESKTKIYVYSWDPRKKKINAYTGYYEPAFFNGYVYEAFLLRDPKKHLSWFRKIPIRCGEFYNNAVWFTEPNLKRAQLIFIKAEIEKLKACEIVIQKAKDNIEFLSNYSEVVND